MARSLPMLVPSALAHCICLANKSPCDLCCDGLCFLDQGIRVTIKPKGGEKAVALALDGCIFNDNQTKCDGLYILSQPGQILVLLVELKATHIDDAYNQISYVVNHRKEYSDVISHARSITGHGTVREKSFIVTTGSINKRTQQKLEKAFGIRPEVITVEKPASAAPDLRKHI